MFLALPQSLSEMRTECFGGRVQRQGLAWMIKMEHPILPKKVDDPPVQLWSMKKDEQVSATNSLETLA